MRKKNNFDIALWGRRRHFGVKFLSRVRVSKHAYPYHFFFELLFIYLFIQVIFANMITYLERTFKEVLNDIYFKQNYFY